MFVVCLCVCLLDTKTDEPIKMPFGLWTRVEPRKHVLVGGPDSPPREGAILGVIPSH